MDILKYPGNLGSIRGTIFTMHHYDWPAYPSGEDFRETLFQLAAFPCGTKFIEVDDGDHSILFAANVANSRLDKPYHHRNFHICSWHEDLIDMHNRGFIQGVSSVTQNAHEFGRWERKLRKCKTDKFFFEHDGRLQEITAPVRDTDDEDEPRNWVLLPTDHISATEAGIEFIANEIKAANIDFSETLSPSIVKLIENKLYDAAIRESCVTLEHSIKAKLKSSSWGDKLTDEFFEYLRDEKNLLESWLRTYSQELRAIFKLVRNVYMHNLMEIDESTATVIIYRIARAKSAIEI